MKKSFIEKLKGETPPIGTLITLNSPEVAEIFSASGFDWLFVDMEHGTIFPHPQRNILFKQLAMVAQQSLEYQKTAPFG